MTKTILVVNDDSNANDKTAALLQSHPQWEEEVKVIGVTSEVEALREFTTAKGKLDLILCTTGQPDTGIQIIEHIRKMGSNIPVVLRTLSVDEEKTNKKL